MIEALVGYPGSGKTLGLVRRVLRYDYIYTNMMLSQKAMPGHCHVVYGDDCVKLVEQLVELWQQKKMRRRTVLAIDEAGLNFPARSFASLPRQLAWLFVEHRHMGIDFLYTTQTMRLVDSMLRGNTSYVYYCQHFFALHMEEAYVGAEEKKKGKNGNFAWTSFYWGPRYYRYYDTFELVAGSDFYIDDKTKEAPGTSASAKGTEQKPAPALAFNKSLKSPDADKH